MGDTHIDYVILFETELILLMLLKVDKRLGSESPPLYCGDIVVQVRAVAV